MPHFEKEQKLDFNYAISLLNNGSRLTVPGSDLNTLEKIQDNKYSWKGLRDIEPTILDEKEIFGLIMKYRFVIDL